MLRRRFLQAGAALTASAFSYPDVPAAETVRPASLKRIGAASAFDYAGLKGLARSLANAAYQAPPTELPPAVAKMTWVQWQSIRFRDDHSLWLGEALRFRVQLFHLGFTIKKPVKIYNIENGQSQELSFDPALFDYSRSGVDGRELPPTLGFAGFRLLFHTDWKRDIVAFQGASYFRAVDGELQYGMSQRGLAIDCGMPRPEEFPDFVAYYLERPPRTRASSPCMACSIRRASTGAYRFVIEVADTLVMDVDAALYPRKTIERLGIAPGPACSCADENDRRVDSRLAARDPRLRRPAAVHRCGRVALATAGQFADGARQFLCR